MKEGVAERALPGHLNASSPSVPSSAGNYPHMVSISRLLLSSLNVTLPRRAEHCDYDYSIALWVITANFTSDDKTPEFRK